MGRRLFDTSVLPRRRQRAITLPVSIALHAAVVSAALIVPMLGDSALPEVAASARVFFSEPPAITAAPPPLARTGPVRPVVKTKVPPVPTNGMVAPPTVPDFLPTEDPAFGNSVGGPTTDGVEFGAPWGTPPGAIIVGLPVVPETVTKPVRMSEGVRGPRKLRYVPPVYPEIARQIRLQGTVLVECTIDPRGRVVNATVVQGNPLLNEAALSAVQQWVYTPTLLSGIPVPVLMQVSVTFALS